MKSLPFIISFCLLCLGTSWLGIVVGSHMQIGNLQPSSSELDEETGKSVAGEPRYPGIPLGTAQQGKIVYNELGCAACHTQQVRRTDYSSDYERQYGKRPSVVRDYIRQERVTLGNIRIGQDLMDVGTRRPDASWHYQHLYNPKSVVEDSPMPRYPFLFEKGENDTPIPTQRAKALVAYLLSLKLDYDLPEAKIVEEKKAKSSSPAGHAALENNPAFDASKQSIN